MAKQTPNSGLKKMEMYFLLMWMKAWVEPPWSPSPSKHLLSDCSAICNMYNQSPCALRLLFQFQSSPLNSNQQEKGEERSRHTLSFKILHGVAKPLHAATHARQFLSVPSPHAFSSLFYTFLCFEGLTWMDDINGLPCLLAPAEGSQQEIHSGGEKITESEVGVSISPACSLATC